MTYQKWETWASWNDCGGNSYTHPDCAYHREQEERELENFDSEKYFKSFPPFRKPIADEKDAAMIESLIDIDF